MSNPSEPVRIEVESVADAIDESEEETAIAASPETDESTADEATSIVVERVNDDEQT